MVVILLIFKDFGSDSSEILTLRAKNIQIRDYGELWVGSRACRYQGRADIVLYGNEGRLYKISTVIF